MTIPPTEPTWTRGIHRTVLQNGLTVLIQADDRVPAVAVVTHVKAGFFDEPDRWVGISHVLEHMFFKGTPTLGVGQVAAETKALGGYLNASTSYDATQYYVVLPAGGLGRALEIQADALRNATIDAGELGRELQVIIQEAKRKLDTPSAVAYEVLNEVMYDQHRMRRWRIGTEAMLAGFTRDDVAGYYRSRYVPERVIVSIVGAVTVADALAKVEALYGDWRSPFEGFEPGPTELPRREVRTRSIRADVHQAELAVGWRAVEPLHPDAAALDVAAGVLSAGRGAWLYRMLRAPGTVTAASAYYYAPTELGAFAISANLLPGSIPTALPVIGSLIDQLRTTGPSAQDLERVTTLFRVRWARRMETVDGRAAAFAHAEALGGLELLDREYHDMLAVTAADVRRVADTYLTPDQASAVAVLPHGQGAPVEAADVRSALVGATGPTVVPIPPVRVTPPAATRGARGIESHGVLHIAGATGDLLIRPKVGVPLVTLGLYRRRRPDPAGLAGLGALALRSIARGAGSWDAERLAAAFEALGGTLGTSTGADWFGVGTTVLTEHAAEAGALLRAALYEPSYRDQDVELEWQNLTEEVRQTADDMFRYPVQMAFAHAFGGTGYGVPVSGWPETVERLSPRAVREWHTREMSHGRTAVVAVGDVDPERLAEQLIGLVDGPARSSEAPAPIEDQVPPFLPPTVVTRAKSQSALAMVFPGPSRRDPARYPAMVWAAVASGLGGRLFTALRDQRSLAYTVMASSWQRASAGALVTYIATAPDREEEARDAMLAELATFRREPVDPEELHRAANYLAGQTDVQRQSIGAVASELVDAWLVGTGLEELDDPSGPFRTVSAEAILELANQSLDPTKRAEGVVRGVGGGR